MLADSRQDTGQYSIEANRKAAVDYGKTNSGHPMEKETLPKFRSTIPLPLLYIGRERPVVDGVSTSAHF